jgi:hypothetical protein
MDHRCTTGLPEQLQVGVLLRQLILGDAQLPLQAAHLRQGRAGGLEDKQRAEGVKECIVQGAASAPRSMVVKIERSEISWGLQLHCSECACLPGGAGPPPACAPPAAGSGCAAAPPAGKQSPHAAVTAPCSQARAASSMNAFRSAGRRGMQGPARGMQLAPPQHQARPCAHPSCLRIMACSRAESMWRLAGLLPTPTARSCAASSSFCCCSRPATS